MLLENVPLGKTLEIYVDRDGYRYRLVSKVEKTTPKRICVSAIMAGTRMFKFRPEDDVRIVYRDEDQMWEWLHVKVGAAKLDGEAIHYFDILDKGRSFNRRQAYRVNINEDVEYIYYKIPGLSYTSAYMPEVEEEYDVYIDITGKESETPPPGGMENVRKETRTRLVPLPGVTTIKSKGRVRDISENGLGIFCNEDFKIGDNFAVQIPSEYGSLLTRCNIIRSDETDKSERKYKYYYGCVYSESDQKLIKHIYVVQRKQIQKQRERKEMKAEYRARKKGE